MMRPMTLTEFLEARIGEDEAVARAAIDEDRPGTHWRWEIPDEGGDADAPRWLRTVEEFPTTSGVGPLPAFPLGYEFVAEPSHAMTHIARHDPARVLAECEAKRRIVELFAETESTYHSFVDAQDHLDSYLNDSRIGVEALTPVVYALASVYADHPDYRPAWKP